MFFVTCPNIMGEFKVRSNPSSLTVKDFMKLSATTDEAGAHGHFRC